jgi:D-alanyl-D-alanine carboxypeptidase
MDRRAIAAAACLLVAVGSAVATAQDEAAPVTIDALCGEAALEPMTAEVTLGADQAAALDAVLRAFVTVPGDPQLVANFAGSQPGPGAVLSVETPNGRYFRSIGVADVESCEPLQPTSPFAIGSHTKMFIAAVIYQLQEEGLLSTSDLVRDYLPDEIALFPRQAEATIDQLLTHTSGLPDWERSVNPEALGPRIYSGDPEALSMAVTPGELIAMTAELQDDADQPTFGPGDQGPADWRYANIGFEMLGLIIEQVTGQPWQEAVRERVFEPLGMADTVLLEGVAGPELGLPSGYLGSPFTTDTNGWNYSQAGAAGNGVSTVDDMATFVEAYYSGELFDDPQTLDAVLEPAAPWYVGWIDGFQYLHAGFDKHGFKGHGGGTPGFVSDAAYSPELDITTVAWINSKDGMGEGVIAAGNALGLTPSMADTFGAIAQKMAESVE